MHSFKKLGLACCMLFNIVKLEFPNILFLIISIFKVGGRNQQLSLREQRERRLVMKINILFSSPLIVLVLCLILGSISYCKASIPQIDYTEIMYRQKRTSDSIWSTKTMTRLFGIEKISNQNLIIHHRVAHVISPKSDARRRPSPEILKWNMEINNKIYPIYVNRDDGTVTVRGEAEDYKEKEKVEHVLKIRAPSNFRIINEIDVFNDLS